MGAGLLRVLLIWLMLLCHQVNISQASGDKGDATSHRHGQGMCQTSATSASRLQYSCLESKHCNIIADIS